MERNNTLEEEFDSGMNSPEHKITEKFMRASRMHRHVLEKHLKETGVYRSQHQLLMYVFKHPNVSQKELASLYRVTPASVAVSLKKLEKGGYIQRVVDEADNRLNQIRITERGREVMLCSIRFFRDVEKGMFDGFSEEEMDRLYGYMCRIYENVDEMLRRIGEEEQNGKI